MPDHDNTKFWLELFTKQIETELGLGAREKILTGSDPLSDQSTPGEKSVWLETALKRLQKEGCGEKCQNVLEGCACVFPPDWFQEIIDTYHQNHDLDEALHLRHQWHTRMHERAYREGFWDVDAETLRMVTENPLIETGVRKGNEIHVRKVPFSSTAYHQTDDPAEKRYLYCHCHWVKAGIKHGMNLSPMCHCGAGHYKDFWEKVTGGPVEVEIVRTILQGDDCCEFVIHLAGDKFHFK